MSQVNTNAIYDASGGQSAQLYGVSMRYGGTNFVNRIINGDMRIDQRNNGAAVTVADNTGTYTLDRWRAFENTDGSINVQQDSSSPEGFTNSLKVTVATTDTSLSATQQSKIEQIIEGFNIADLGWGTANAKTVTLSFWVRSSVTGTFGGALQNSGGDRAYPFTYVISFADTWEYKTVIVPGDTSGTWLNTNGIGVRTAFALGAGTDRSGTAGVWNSNNNVSATGATNLMATSGATFYITGVQLEAGSVATPFERRPYGTELALCQRYYWQAGANGYHMYIRGLSSFSASCGLSLNHPVQMRASPTANGITGANVTGLAVGASDSTGAIIVGAASAAGSTASILTLSFGAEL